MSDTQDEAYAAGGTAPGRANLSAALGMDTATQITGRLFALAPKLVELQDLGAREYGLTYARGRVLAALHVSGPVLMRTLAQAVGVRPRTMTGLIDSLEADGWVARRADPTDRRATIIATTPAADQVFGELLAQYASLAARLLDGIPEDDKRRALAVIDHITGRLSEITTGGIASPSAGRPVLPRERPAG